MDYIFITRDRNEARTPNIGEVKLDYTTIFQGVLMLIVAGFLTHGFWLKKRDKDKLDDLSSRVTKLENTAIDHEEAKRIVKDEIVSLEKETKALEREITALKVSIDSLRELITLLRIELAANGNKK